jgi:hypothetical protein
MWVICFSFDGFFRPQVIYGKSVCQPWHYNQVMTHLSLIVVGPLNDIILEVLKCLKYLWEPTATHNLPGICTSHGACWVPSYLEVGEGLFLVILRPFSVWGHDIQDILPLQVVPGFLTGGFDGFNQYHVFAALSFRLSLDVCTQNPRAIAHFVCKQLLEGGCIVKGLEGELFARWVVILASDAICSNGRKIIPEITVAFTVQDFLTSLYSMPANIRI